MSDPFIHQAPKKYAVVLNPNAGSGRAGRHFARLDAEIAHTLGEYALFQTKGSGHGTELTRQALHEGYDRIVSAGGDGTHFEVVNGFFEGGEAINPEASMAVLGVGTASDLSRTYNVPKGRGAIAFLNSDRVLPVDIGRLSSTGEDGETVVRYFNTAVHMGLGGLVAEHSNRRTKVLGGFLTFLLGVITARIEYTDCEMSVECDGETVSDTFMEVIVAKGFYDGGGMHVAPNGVLDNGFFEVYTMGEMGLLDTLRNIPKMYQGTQLEHPAVHYRRAKCVTVSAGDRVAVSPDGEVAGVLPATMEVVPKALRVVVGPDPRVVNRERV